MPKRKKDKEDNIQRKIIKYEKRLAKYRDNKDQSSEVDPEVVDLPEDSDTSPNIDRGVAQEESNIGVYDVTHDPDAEMGEAQARDIDTSESPALDNEFLSALGESSSGMRQYGEEIHKEIFNTVNKILLEGMSKQNKEKVLENLLIPSNCKLLDAPKLNTELIGVMNNPSRIRDKLMEDRQQELGLAIGEICSVTNSMSRQVFNKYEVIKKLTDTSRILCYLHFQYTEIRRKLVNPFLDKSLVESLKDNKREEFLYSNLDNSVKSYSAMKRQKERRAANTIKLKPTYTARNALTPKNFQQAPRRPLQVSQAHPGRGSYRGAHRYPTPRQHFRPQENRATGPSVRGRAKYP